MKYITTNIFTKQEEKVAIIDPKKVGQFLTLMNALEFIKANYEDQEDTLQAMQEDIANEYQELNQEEVKHIDEMANDYEGGFDELYIRYPQATTPTNIRLWMGDLSNEE